MNDKTLVERKMVAGDIHAGTYADLNRQIEALQARVDVLEAEKAQAAKAERDRIVAWLRSDKPDRDNGGPCRHVEHSQGNCICNELADALESQP